MSLSDEFDTITGAKPPKKKAAAPIDTARIKTEMDRGQYERGAAIAARDKARADSSSLEAMSDLAGREWVFKDIANKQHEDSKNLGQVARTLDTGIAKGSAKLGAQADSLKLARALKGKK